MLLAVPFGLAIGLSLGLVGAGGSILAVPVLVYVFDEPVKSATTASLMIVGASALVAAIARVGRGCICWRLAIVFGVTGAVGTVAGTALSSRASGEAILVLFALVMLTAAYGMVRRGNDDDASVEEPPLRWSRVLPLGIGLGAMTGFFGIGGGFLVVPALVLFLGVPLRRAAGTSLLVIAMTSAGGLVVHLTSGSRPDWGVALVFTAAAVVGGLGGTRFARRASPASLTHAFAALVVVVAVFLLIENAPSLV